MSKLHQKIKTKAVREEQLRRTTVKRLKMSVSSVYISPFNCLLNSISNDLSPENLRSLIHICQGYIPECKRHEIKNGLDVFLILRHQNVIGEDREKVHNFEKFMKEMRPKRRDIIGRVREFIRTNYDPDYDFQSSGELPAVLVDRQPRFDRNYSSGLDSLSGQRDLSDEVGSSNTENHCSIDCCCLGCNCYARRIPSCVLLILTGIMAILTFLSSLLWYGEVPQTLYHKMGPDAQKAGGYVVGCCGVAAIAFLSWWIYRKLRRNRHIGQVPYQSFKNPAANLPVAFDDSANASSTVAVKGSTASVKLPIKKQKRKPFGSVTAESSLDTAASASVVEREQRKHHFTPKHHRRPHRKSMTEDGGLQTDGACGSEETDEFQSKESLFPVDYSDFSSDEPTTVPPMTAE